MEKLEVREREAARIPAMALGPLPESVPAEVEAAACCLSCGTALRGEFCHGCGARSAEPDDLQLGRMARMAAREATDLDSRMLVTLRRLLFTPGFLTAEFVRGVRGAYVGPVRLFVWAYAAAVVMFSIPWFQPYLSPAGGGPLGPQQEAAVRAIVAARKIPEAMARELLESQAQTYATWFSGLIILGFALAVLLLHLRSHRPFGVHAVFSLHFGAFNYFVGLALVPALVLASLYPTAGGLLVTVAVLGITTRYMYLAVRRVYGRGRLVSAAKTLVLLLAFSASQLAVSALAYALARAALT